MVINPLCMAPKIAAESSPFVAQRDVCLGGIEVTSDGICCERLQSDFTSTTAPRFGVRKMMLSEGA
jgi:hypothetical protein